MEFEYDDPTVVQDEDLPFDCEHCNGDPTCPAYIEEVCDVEVFMFKRKLR